MSFVSPNFRRPPRLPEACHQARATWPEGAGVPGGGGMRVYSRRARRNQMKLRCYKQSISWIATHFTDSYPF
jgi:hypothetical protein